MSPDPWAEIGRAGGGFSLRRVDPGHPANFYWGKDNEGRCALVLSIESSVRVNEARPVLNGIRIIEAPDQDGKNAFVLLLKNSEDRELFRQLCEDIVETCRDRSGDHAFLASAIRRAWKWHSLLRGGARNRLGPEEQQGLVGELLFLERLVTETAPRAAVEAWRGPLDEPKDFVFGGRAVEVKARHLGKEAVKISSETQLQVLEGQELYLAVFGLSPATSDTPEAVCLTSTVERVRQVLITTDPSVEEALEARLLSAGYAAEETYDDLWWSPVSLTAFAVEEDFPRIESTALPPGVGTVTYWLSLDRCSRFERPLSSIFGTK